MNFEACHSHSHKEIKYKNVPYVDIMLSHSIWYNPTMSSLHLDLMQNLKLPRPRGRFFGA